jgi:hypothetical protein
MKHIETNVRSAAAICRFAGAIGMHLAAALAQAQRARQRLAAKSFAATPCHDEHDHAV